MPYDTTWIKTLQDWWWLALLLLALLARLWKTAIKTNKRLEELEKVKKHEESIKGLEEKFTKIERSTAEIQKKLERQNKDTRVINASLLAILDALHNSNCEGLGDARDNLRNHLIDER